MCEEKIEALLDGYPLENTPAPEGLAVRGVDRRAMGRKHEVVSTIRMVRSCAGRSAWKDGPAVTNLDLDPCGDRMTHAQCRLTRRWVLQKFVRCAIGDDPALVQEDDPVAKRKGILEVVQCQHGGARARVDVSCQ